MTELTASERELLDWLGQEDTSQYGECHGPDLNSLIAKGLVELCDEETEMHNTFIAKGRGIMYRAIRLTEVGIKMINDGQA